MEEKKLDLNSIIGFVLISGLLIWMLYSNAPTPEEIKEKEKKEQVEKQTKEVKTITSTVATTPIADSLKNAAAQAQLGSFLSLIHI